MTWCVFSCSSSGASDIQGRYSPRELISTLIHGRDPIPCRTTYIEYKSQGKDSLFFCRNTTQFHWFSWQSSFFHCSTTPVVEVTLGELEKLIFFNKTKINLSFRVTWCFFNVPVQELQTSRVATPQRELIYTLIHGRDPIPCRTTYIEYKSQGEDSLFLNRNTTQFHWFSLQSRFFSLFYGTSRGGNLRWAWKTHFFNKTKINLSFRVTWCFFNVPVQELQTSRVATPQGNWSIPLYMEETQFLAELHTRI